jgi:hypothetical protein
MQQMRPRPKGRALVARPAPTLRGHPHLYQINTWAWLERLSRVAGHQITLADVADAEWDRIRGSGIDLVYLLGVWQRSPAGRYICRTDPVAFRRFDEALPHWTLDCVVGSAFSIRNYVLDQRIGTWSELDAVRAKLNARGMRLLLDFVPNHTGPDHVWVAKYPQYFVQGSEADYRRDPAAFHLIETKTKPRCFIARGRDPYFAPWADTAQIDHFNPDARAALIDVLRKIAKHCDGLRCDMTMLVLNDVFGRTWRGLLGARVAPAREFWSEAIAALPRDFIWMAEVYWDMESRLQNLGFQFTYDKRLYDCLLGGAAQEVRQQLNADVDYQSRMARFLENHDEKRSVVAFGRERIPGLAALTTTLPGLRFFHDGQFEARSIHLPVQLNAAAEEQPDRDLAQIYAKILDIANNAAFHEGDWKLLDFEADSDASHLHLLGYRWRTAADYWLIVVNLGATSAHGRLRIADELATHEVYEFTDVLNDASYSHRRVDLLAAGLYVRLDGYCAHIFHVRG